MRTILDKNEEAIERLLIDAEASLWLCMGYPEESATYQKEAIENLDRLSKILKAI